MYVSVLGKRNESLASQYLALIKRRVRWCSLGGSSRADAENSGPVILPRMVQGTIFTLGLLRIRLVLPILLAVMT